MAGYTVRRCAQRSQPRPTLLKVTARDCLREYIQFLNIARGSLAETEYYILFMRDSGLLQKTIDVLRPLLTDGANLLLGLIRSLQAKLPASEREPKRISDGIIAYNGIRKQATPRPTAIPDP